MSPKAACFETVYFDYRRNCQQFALGLIMYVVLSYLIPTLSRCRTRLTLASGNKASALWRLARLLTVVRSCHLSQPLNPFRFHAVQSRTAHSSTVIPEIGARS